LVPSPEVHSARSVVLFSTFLKAERNVRFNSLALAPSISASTTNSSPVFVTEPFADSCPRACRIVPASERLTRALRLSFIWVAPSAPPHCGTKTAANRWWYRNPSPRISAMPMRTFTQHDPLTDAELDRLGDFLKS